jgi:hypothetical protein
MTFYRPFDRSSITSIADANASPNAYSIAYHRPFHRRCSIPPHPRSDGTRCSAEAALAFTESRCNLEKGGERRGLADERWE